MNVLVSVVFPTLATGAPGVSGAAKQKAAGSDPGGFKSTPIDRRLRRTPTYFVVIFCTDAAVK
ncbi:MAG TPA: hypothetical protein VGE51_05195 [Fontimonas sp.]